MTKGRTSLEYPADGYREGGQAGNFVRVGRWFYDKKRSTKKPKKHRQELTDFTYTLIYTAFTDRR